jgi:hypothetical protein
MATSSSCLLVGESPVVVEKRNAKLTRPTERSAGFIQLMWPTFTDSRAVESDQAQIQGPSQLIIECHEIPSETHAETAKNNVTLGITHLGKGDGAARGWMGYFLSEFRREDVLVDSQVDRVCTGGSFSI